MMKRNWDKIEALFSEAVDLPENERTIFLDKACGGDTDLLKEVNALLEDFASACGYFDAFGKAISGETESHSPIKSGDQIGNYVIQKEIGRGGMSVVYLAKRNDGQYEEEVAIKVLKKGLDTAAILSRFHTERQLLANLRHPGIATILVGGETSDGQPYLVMEYINGLPLNQALATETYDLSSKLALFQQIISAVDQAHRQLVVHRDIKPGNIMITNQGQVKLLDFGIAKIIKNPHEDLATQIGQRFFTPRYSAPEQKDGGTISTATDVYQLGLLLFEILTEKQVNFPPHKPPLASNQIEDDSLKKKLKGDLDSIIAKALREDPSRRYGSAAEMGRDIEAYLANRPIDARPENWSYLARKFIQRNRLTVAAGILIIALLITGVITTSWQAYRAQIALAKEKQAREKAERIKNFLVYLFESADPYERQDNISGRNLTLEDFLDQSLSPIREDLKDEPEIQMELLEIMGKLYNRLSQKKEGYKLASEVLKMTQNYLGENSPEFAGRAHLLAGTAADLGKYEEADSLFAIALQATKKAYGFAPRHLAVVYNDYGIMKYELGENQIADSMYKEAIRIMRINQISDTANYAQTLNNRAQTLQKQGNSIEAASLMQEAIRILKEANLDQTIFMAHANNQMASLMIHLDSLEKAQQYQLAALEGFKEFLGENSHFFALGKYNLSKIYEATGKYELQAEAIQQSMAIMESIYGKENVNYGVLLFALGKSHQQQNRNQEALENYRMARGIFERFGVMEKLAEVEGRIESFVASPRVETAGQR